MDLPGLLDALRAIGPRAACSDAERRAAKLLAGELRGLERRPRTETLWIRPQWPAVWLVLAVLGVAGSVVSADAAIAGLALCAVGAVVAMAELGGRLPLLSLLWPRRATQNVMSDGPGRAPVRLLITAAYDAPRSRPAFAGPPLAADAALRRATGGLWPSPLGLLTLALLVLTGCTAARVAELDPAWLGVVQLLPTVACISAVAILADLALAPATEASNPSASAPAAALALVAALDRRPPRRLEVDVLFAGAGSAGSAGMRRFVRSRRKTLRREGLAVLHLEPCGAGTPRAWRRDGQLLVVRLHPQLVAAAVEAGFTPLAGRGLSGALIARRQGWPAVAVGRRDPRGRVPDEVDEAELQDTVDRCLELVRRLDAGLAGRTS